MNSASIKFYKREFPNINLNKLEFTSDDIILILSKYINDINFESDKILSIINLMDKTLIGKEILLKRFKVLFNPKNEIGASKFQIKYWIDKGHSEKYSKSKVSEIQKRNSKRSIDYWIKNGYNADDAKIKVSDYQRDKCNIHNTKNKDKIVAGEYSPWCSRYWIIKGYSLEDSKNLVSALQIENSKNTKLIPLERRKTFNPFFIEYWKIRFPNDNYVEMFIEYHNKVYKFANQRSKIGDEFFDKLAKYYPSNKLYYSENEYGRYIENVGYRKYDYIDSTLQVCVEFHGRYWHSSEESKINDIIKKDFIESLGYTYYFIKEFDYYDNKELCILNLVERINSEFKD